MLQAFASGRLFGATYGTGTPRVLALHGWRRDHRDFDVTLQGFDALALDLPGFGSTPPPEEAWGSAEYATALHPVLEEMQSPAVVIGHSFGGRVGVHLAAQRPDAIAALILTGVPLLRRPSAGKPKLSFRVARTLNQAGLYSDERMNALRQKYGSEDYKVAQGVMREIFVKVVNETYEDQLRAVRCPLALVWGADDTAAPLPMAEEAAAMVPGATLTALPGVGHMTPIQAPDALRAALERHRG